MTEAVHIYLTDADIEKIRNDDFISFDFEKGELGDVRQILIMKEKEEMITNE